ncbi:MAG: putative 26S proteasome regulatory subunit [Chrysothrix sp. TS-e1954]|nr:MAG: putative 26S proteasome regulatory subunit [Chrysothrix sp. TS-e1954]
MGLPIENIHASSVSSQAPQVAPQDGATMEQLMFQKQQLEGELNALGDVLVSHGVTMRTGLTTLDGFPRADIDVAQIRTTRARIIHLRNDHKALMSRIETGLHSHFATSAAAGRAPSDPTMSSAASDQELSTSAATFAKVNSVVPSSPADTAGLKVGDRIQTFGEANWLNHEKLSKVAQIVGQSEGVPVIVAVIRRRPDADVWDQRRLTLVPKSNWGGRGLLGCHLVPM